MGESKRKEEASKVVQIVHLCKQEMFFLLQAANSIPTKEHAERRKLDRVFEQLGLDDFEDAIQEEIKAAAEAGGLNLKTLDKTPKSYELDMATVEYLVEKLKTIPVDRGSLASRIIGRICEKLIQVVDGRYVPPVN